MNFLSSLYHLSNLAAKIKPYQLHIVADSVYIVNHQRRGFQRVNFRVIPSPLGVKALIPIPAEEAAFRRIITPEAHLFLQGLDSSRLI